MESDRECSIRIPRRAGPEAQQDYFESYELDDKVGQDHSYGSFTAPTTGIHGWFWENKGKKQVQIHLTTSGFYDSAKMYAGDKPDELEIQDAK